MFLSDLAARIRRQRERLGLTQQALARALNVTAQAVSKWERAENAPDISLLVPLAELLDVSTDWLLAPGGQRAPGPELRAGRFEACPEGYGFVRLAPERQANGDRPAPGDDVYVSPSLIRRFDLKSGNMITCSWRPPRGAERFPAAVEIAELDGRAPAPRQPPAPGPAVEVRQTPRARKILAVAREEARQYNHEFLGAEHILLALVGGGGAAAHVLRSLGIDLDRVRAETEKLMRAEPESVAPGELPLTPGSEAALEQARHQAQTSGDGALGTDHLLLGLLHQADSVAAKVLTGLGLTAGQVEAGLGRRQD